MQKRRHTRDELRLAGMLFDSVITCESDYTKMHSFPKASSLIAKQRRRFPICQMFVITGKVRCLRFISSPSLCALTLQLIVHMHLPPKESPGRFSVKALRPPYFILKSAFLTL